MKNKPIRVNEEFKIPQIEFEESNYIDGKKKFQPSIAASPFFGSKVKDRLYVQDAKGTVDVRVAYDNFRDEKDRKISDEEKIKKYGTVYNEFQFLNEDSRKKHLGTEYVPEKKVVEMETKEEVIETHTLETFISTPELEKDIHEELFTPSEDDLKIKLDFDIEDLDDKKIELESLPKEELTEENSSVLYEEEVLDSTLEETLESDEEFNYDNYELPPLSLFKTTSIYDNDVPEWLINNKENINQTLSDFDIEGEVINYTKGPTFTRYEIMLAPGIKVNRVSNIKDNIQMNLGAKSIRILAPIPGKNTVGIEVPNQKTDTVYFGDIVSNEYVHDNHPINVALGKDIDGHSVSKRIEDMPHLLVAGATKSGKSVCINTILVSLLIKNKPDEVKLILVDPKRVELAFYADIPHLATPVITDMELASLALKWAVDEMDRRYEVFKNVGVRNIETYNEKLKHHEIDSEKLPFIVIVIDELADLMMNYQKEVEDHIERITHMARAVGIHLIVATQRPTVQVISGNIKANIPTRIAFKVAAAIDSTTILDEGGAEDLLGRGDMLIKDNDGTSRLQGAYISDDEIKAVCRYARENAPTEYLFTPEELTASKVLDNTGAANYKHPAVSDSILYEVAKHCIERESCSSNDITNRFNFGFNRAKNICDQLEGLGIVGPKTGSSKGREILITIDELNKMFNK